MIFISYRHDDVSDVVGRAYGRLVRIFPGQVFKDVDSIPPGVQFPDYLAKYLSKTRVLLLIIGPKWLGPKSDGTYRIYEPEDFLRIEIETALKLGITFIPVIVGNTVVPFSGQLPDSILELSQLQTLKLRPDPDFGTDMERLVRNLRKYIKPRRFKWLLVLCVTIFCFLFIFASINIAPQILHSNSRLSTINSRITKFLDPKQSGWKLFWSTLKSWNIRSNDEASKNKVRKEKSSLGLENDNISKGVTFQTAWIFMGYYDENQGLFKEGPFGRVAFRANGARGEILPEIGDVIEIFKERQLIIGRYHTQGLQYELTPPANLSDPLSDNDDTGQTLSKGSLVIVRDIDINGYPTRLASVWCRVCKCDSDTPSCKKAKAEVESR